jgi:hypothetical protein
MSISTSSVTTAGNVVYTSSGNTAVTWLSICNYDASDITANVYVVPSAGSVGNSTIVFANLAITATDTYQIYAGGEKLLLEDGDTVVIQANANTVTAVTSYTSI